MIKGYLQVILAEMIVLGIMVAHKPQVYKPMKMRELPKKYRKIQGSPFEFEDMAIEL